MNCLSVAIIGAGNIAGGYDENRLRNDTGVYTHAGAYVFHGGFQLCTVYDCNKQRMDDFRRIWKVEKEASSLDDIYDGHHDVISVCTPDETHFDIVRDILTAGCCRTVFVEKPLAMTTSQIEELICLADEAGIQIVVNFQRRNERVHREFRDFVAAHSGNILSVTCHYMKGLHHIGVTIIDTLCYLCGYPEAVLTYNRVFNREVNDFSYEAVLYYSGYTAVVKTIDNDRFLYNYHIFEVDVLFSDSRKALVDISQAVRESSVTSYAYSGVKVINERTASCRETEYKLSMRDAVGYVYAITNDHSVHEINTPHSSYNNSLIIDHIVESFERGSVKLHFEKEQWKK